MSDIVPESPVPAQQPPVQPPAPAQQPPAQPPAAKKGFAVTALVLGIVAIVGSWIPFVSIVSIIIGIVGLVFGIVAFILAVSGKAAGKVMAIVGGGLSLLAIIFGIISTSAGAKAVDDALDDLGDITSSPAVTSEAPTADATTSAEPTDTAEAPSTGTIDNPAAVGDGTIWTFSQGDDTWDVTFDKIQLVNGYNGKVAVVTGTATPTAIGDGDTSSWASFPVIDWMADGAKVDDTYDIPKSDKFDDYRNTIELEATVGTEMKFYSSVGLPDGVVPDLMTAEVLFGDDTIYFATGLTK